MGLEYLVNDGLRFTAEAFVKNYSQVIGPHWGIITPPKTQAFTKQFLTPQSEDPNPLSSHQSIRPHRGA